MVGKAEIDEIRKSVDDSQLPVRILHTYESKWDHGAKPFDFPAEVTRFKLEFVCFLREECEDLDVDISAILFDAKGNYVETVGYGCPTSTDGGIVHNHDSVHTEAGKIAEDIDFDLSVVHKRVYSACLLATTYGNHTFAGLRSIQIRFLAPSHLLSDSLEREIARIVYTEEGCLGREASLRPSAPNALVLGDLRRQLLGTDVGRGEPVNGPRPAGAWNVRAPRVIASTVARPHEAIPILQCYLREWIPSIEVIGQELSIRRVYDIVSFLPLEDLEALRGHWVKAGASGVNKEVFMGNMLRVLLRTHSKLRNERQRVQLTSLLSDLFDQISGTKRGGSTAASEGLAAPTATLGWEQFTTFWVEAATINTHSETVRCWADETLQWAMDPHFELAIRKPTKLISLPLLHLVVGLEERGSLVSVLNGGTGRLHITLCPSSLQTVTTGGVNPHDSFLTVLDVECVDTKGIIIVSSTDHAISVWHYNYGNENAIWRCSLHSRSAQILVSWVAHERGYLVSAGVDYEISVWCVDRQLRLAVIQGHRARVTGVTYIPQHRQFATCSFDKTVRLWDASHFTPVAEMKLRSSVKFVEACGDLLLCITMEVEAPVLSVSNRKPWCRLIGHKHLIVGAAMVQFADARLGRQIRCITGDQNGDFFIWNTGSGQKAKDGLAEVIQSFSVYAWRPNLGEIVGFERFHRHLPAVNGSVKSEGEIHSSMSHVWPDIVVRGVGGTMVIRTQQIVKDARMANVLACNDKSMVLIASTGQNLRFWDLQTSDPLRTIASPCPHGITAVATDKPDQKRIYLGTSDGGIAVVHIVTGQLLFELKNVHHGAVTQVNVCTVSGDVVSVGTDRRVKVHSEKGAGVGLGLIAAGCIEEAHKSTISACAVSQETQLIATAAGGEIRLWHKQDLSFQGGISDLDADVLGLVFLPRTVCLLASDSDGDVVLWTVDFDKACPVTTAAGAADAGAAGATRQGKTAAPEKPASSTVAPVAGAQANAPRETVAASTPGSRSAPAWEAKAVLAAGDDADGTKLGNFTCMRAVDVPAASVIGGRGSRRFGEPGARTGGGVSARDHGNCDQPDKKLPLPGAPYGDASPALMNSTPSGESLAAISPESQRKQQEFASSPAATYRRTWACALRPRALLSSRSVRDQRRREHNDHSQQANEHQHPQLPSPVFDILLHSMYDDYTPTQAVSPPQNGSPDNMRLAFEGDYPAPKVPNGSENRPPGQPPGGGASNCRRRHRAKRRTKLLVITGSAAGWVEVWETEGLVAASGVDEEAMEAKLLRLQPAERGTHLRTTRHRRSGLTCCPPSASLVLMETSTSITVKGALEALIPIPPSVRWEAHIGSPVSSLCALDKTPLVATASTDSTVRLFTLADIQVGAQPFKAAENLGEIDMRDTESVRIDRAEMWSCPSLTAAEVRPPAEIDAYRAFSGTICAEIEKQTSVGKSASFATPVKSPTPSHSEGSRDAGPSAGAKEDLVMRMLRDGMVHPVPRVSPPPRSTRQEEGAATTAPCTRIPGHSPAGGVKRGGFDGSRTELGGNHTARTTFLTAVRQPDLNERRSQHTHFVSGGNSDEAAGQGSYDGCFAGPSSKLPVAEDSGSGAKGSGCYAENNTRVSSTARSRLPNIPAGHDATGDGLAVAGGQVARVAERRSLVEEGEDTRAAAEEATGRGPRPGWDQGRYPLNCFDKQRATLYSASAARNHLGEVLYGNMYRQITSGAAINALVAEFVFRKKNRAYAKIDTEVSPFLRDNLPVKPQSLAERKTTRRRLQNAAARGSAEIIPARLPDCIMRSASSLRQHEAANVDVVASSRSVRGTGHPKRERPEPDGGGNRTQALVGEELSPNACDGSRHDGSDCTRRDRGRRQARSASCDELVRSGQAKPGRSFDGSDQNRDRTRRRERVGDLEQKQTADAAESTRKPPRSSRQPAEPAGRAPREGGHASQVVPDNGKAARRRRRRGEEATGSDCGELSLPPPRADDIGGGRTTITTSASLHTLSLREMEERQSGSRRNGDVSDALDSLVHLSLEPGGKLVKGGQALSKSVSSPSAGLQQRWKQMLEWFDGAVSPSPLESPPASARRAKWKSQATSTVGAYIRQKPEKRTGAMGPAFAEPDEALLSVANIGIYRRSEIEALGKVFLIFASEGHRVTYDMWRTAIMRNSGVKMLKGIQFGMLDGDNDGEVSLSDITRAVFRRASDRDLPRIRKFLELWLKRERQNVQRRQVCKVFKETQAAAFAAPLTAKSNTDSSPPSGDQTGVIAAGRRSFLAAIHDSTDQGLQAPSLSN